jgi:hypothetical protein
VAVGDNTVKTNLVEVGGLKLQHLVNTSTVDGVSSLADLLVVALTTKARSNQLLAVLVKKIECGLVSTCRDLDQLGKAVSDLCLGQSLQEREVQEGVNGGVVGTKPVLVVAVVNGNLDTDTGVDETNDCGRDTDEVGVPAVCGARESTDIELALFCERFQARVP